ncbi:aldo/keto reductase [Amycolatopsis sp. DG1A-15b]|uniref:aldo/keto reductase n=1 Tax=Amycolatopsis sp. DG1A-15b TaxID=3052846 RepID=UPI00255C0794|nr:aldo/keto reductase [Amycolatopsis sp. DG1A-15b]WIX85732.1 aldo/keto reductase [Amycolatopsis sp. DG1A-15b]
MPDDRFASTRPVLPIGATAARRLGFGSMQLTGPGHWGRPQHPDEAISLLRAAVDHGVTHIDTADAYGPHVAETLIHDALHPYPDDLLLATKGGLTRQGPNKWSPLGRPEYLRQCVEMSLRRLNLERIDLYYLHRIDLAIPLEDQLGVLADMQSEGKINHIGLSKVSVQVIRRARELVLVAAVQNKYSIANRLHNDVLEYCATRGIPFVPYAPLGAGRLLRADSPLVSLARARGVTTAQLALAWLLHVSPVVMPIPGTCRTAHLVDNLSAHQIALKPEEMKEIDIGLVSAR